MSFNEISKLAKSVSQYVQDSEKLSVPVVAARVRKALQEFPEDPTISAMANVLTRMADKKSFISRGEFRKMYQGFYSRNTRFGEIFASELGASTELKGPTLFNREGESVQEDYEKYADPVLANALKSAFDGSGELKVWSEKAALDSVRKVSQMFSGCGLECRASVATGSPDCVVVEASFETPKGRTNVFVPVEVMGSSILTPSTFVSNRGSEEFTSQNIVDYVKKYAGNSLQLQAKQLLGVVENIKSASKKSVSSVELALTKWKAANQTKNEYFVNQVTGLTVMAEDNSAEVALPEVKDPEIQSFAAKFDSPLGRANFLFGERKVTAARRSVEFSLRECGIKSAQLAVADNTDDTLSFAVKADGVAIMIPVKMKTASPTAEVFVCNGSVKLLNRTAVDSLMKKCEVDFKAAAVASPLYKVKPSELVEAVRTAMVEGNLAKAEDALNVLATSGDEKAYGVAMAAYMQGLGGKIEKTASESCCTRVIKTANSKFPICGHTGLPVHKVYQDGNGDCHPLYRKGMSESYEGASFMNSKIFF